MRGKRSKQYRKLMREYQLGGGFREPYQALVTSDLVLETMKVDLVKYLESVFHGTVKPMITTCSMRAMYAQNREPGVAAAIERAKGFERRRCGHLMDAPAEAEFDCVVSVVDAKGAGRNVNHLCVGTQDDALRRRLRAIPFVPMCYSKRSVMILEPASAATLQARESEEKAKFRDGLKTKKRKRADEEAETPAAAVNKTAGGSDDDDDDEPRVAQPNVVEPEEHEVKRKKRARGPKGPNPLSMRKAKPRARPEEQGKGKQVSESVPAPETEEPAQPKAKRKRRKKQKGDGDDGPVTGGETGEETRGEGISAESGEPMAVDTEA